MYPLRLTSIKNNPELRGMAGWIRDVVYSEETGTVLTMQILMPWTSDDPLYSGKRWPCVVFVQGSAWTFPDVGYELPQLASLARNGYVVATVTHRSAKDWHKAPAFLEDVKTAIRFLRKESERFSVDVDRIGIWGTSSGGNTALLVGLTADDPQYETKEHQGVSDAVQAVVDCFGPSDLHVLFEQGIPETDEDGSASIFIRLLGDTKEDQLKHLAYMDPIQKVQKGKAYPSFLLLHGDADAVVPYTQSETMAQILCENDVHTELVRVEGAPHEGNFWSQELLDMIADFLVRVL